MNGTFDDVLDSNLGGQVFEWSLIHNPNNVQIELADIGGVPGDYKLERRGRRSRLSGVAGHTGLDDRLAADGTQDGIVNQDDYEFWVARFGNPLGGGSVAANVPEPATYVLLILTAAGTFIRRDRAPLQVSNIV